MGSRFPSHKLSNGLIVSGWPENRKEKTSTISSAPMPYTGGDIKKSGELGRMFDIPVDGSQSQSRKSGPISNAPSRTGSFGGATSHSGPIYHNSGSNSMKKTNSGPLSKHGEPIKKTSGPQSGGATPRHNSGPLAPVLPTTGLLTSHPISSDLLNSSGAPRKISGTLDRTGSSNGHGPSIAKNLAVTILSRDDDHSFIRSFPRFVLWAMIMLFVMSFIAGVFILGAVHNMILLVVVIALFIIVGVLVLWNSFWGRRAVLDYITRYPDADLERAKDGQYVKVSGTVTCGNVPLESSFQKVPKCVYTSTSLFEYRGWDTKAANHTHRRFTWGLRASERHAVDFYISDSQSGLRALVKTGFGARVTAYVEESCVVEADPSKKGLSPELLRWLSERNLSTDDDCMMQLKEGCIKEGGKVSVMGVVQRLEKEGGNVLMIVPPPEPFTTGCQWLKCIFPGSLDGIVLSCEAASRTDVIQV